MIAIPAPYQEILIYNEVYEADRKMKKSFHICKSNEYMGILGENNMDKRHTFWTVIDLPDMDH